MGFRTHELYEWIDKIEAAGPNGRTCAVLEFYGAAVKEALRGPYVAMMDSPADYKCSQCEKRNVKLWRQYNTMASCVELLCLDCAEKDQKENIEKESKYTKDIKTDTIGWLVPAVPDFDGTYWGYTSVPQDGVIWWHSLPGTVRE